jgi:L-alanine-DL-glutamate epimerase-like enolase superfamily enzyme
MAARLQARAIRAFKVKLGRDARTEWEALQELRRAIPSRAILRLDANGVWSPEEARRRLASFRSLGIEFVEQPVAPDRAADLGQCDIPWAADESLREGSPPDCDVFVLKPAVLGGFDRSLRIGPGHASVASHLFDGPVALAACCELALTLSGPPLACSVDTHDALAAFPPMNVPQFRLPGEIVPSDRTGLGFSKEEREEIASWIP